MLSNLLVREYQISAVQQSSIEVLLLQLLHQLLLRLKILDEPLFDFIHSIDLGPPLIELLRQYIDNTVTANMAIVLFCAHVAEIAVVLNAEVRPVLLRMEAKAACFGLLLDLVLLFVCVRLRQVDIADIH